jgi:hypothetical protein
MAVCSSANNRAITKSRVLSGNVTPIIAKVNTATTPETARKIDLNCANLSTNLHAARNNGIAWAISRMVHRSGWWLVCNYSIRFVSKTP